MKSVVGAGAGKAKPAKKSRGASSAKHAISLGKKRKADVGGISSKGKGARGANADGGQGDEPLVDPLPPDFPAVSVRPHSCLTAESPFLELGEGDRAESTAQQTAEGEPTPVGEIDAGRLRPGGALQRCSGADVMLAKSAMVVPQLAKGRGRYLIILPGSFVPRMPSVESVGQGGNGEKQTCISERDEEKKRQEEGEADGGTLAAAPIDTGKGHVVADGDEAKWAEKKGHAGSADGAKAKSTPVEPRLLGTLEKLGTENPVLRLPFPDGRVMIFRGRLVSTSSSFMALTCKGGRGTVSCKDIFSSAIVFGEVGWEENGSPEPDAALAEAEASDPSRSLRHFGPSERAVDGGRAVSSRKSRWRSSVKRGTSSSRSAPAATIKNGDPNDGRKGGYVSPTLPIDDGNDGSDEEFVVVGGASDAAARPVAKKKMPCRSRGATSRINYAEMAGKSSDDEAMDERSGGTYVDNEDDSSVEILPTKKRAYFAAGRQTVVPAKKRKSGAKASSERKPARKSEAPGTNSSKPKEKELSAALDFTGIDTVDQRKTATSEKENVTASLLEPLKSPTVEQPRTPSNSPTTLGRRRKKSLKSRFSPKKPTPVRLTTLDDYDDFTFLG